MQKSVSQIFFQHYRFMQYTCFGALTGLLLMSYCTGAVDYVIDVMVVSMRKITFLGGWLGPFHQSSQCQSM